MGKSVIRICLGCKKKERPVGGEAFRPGGRRSPLGRGAALGSGRKVSCATQFVFASGYITPKAFGASNRIAGTAKALQIAKGVLPAVFKGQGVTAASVFADKFGVLEGGVDVVERQVSGGKTMCAAGSKLENDALAGLFCPACLAVHGLAGLEVDFDCG